MKGIVNAEIETREAWRFSRGQVDVGNHGRQLFGQTDETCVVWLIGRVHQAGNVQIVRAGMNAGGAQSGDQAQQNSKSAHAIPHEFGLLRVTLELCTSDHGGSSL